MLVSPVRSYKTPDVVLVSPVRSYKTPDVAGAVHIVRSYKTPGGISGAGGTLS